MRDQVTWSDCQIVRNAWTRLSRRIDRTALESRGQHVVWHVLLSSWWRSAGVQVFSR